MLSQFYKLFSQKIQLIFSQSKWAVIPLLLVFCVSCSSSKPPEIALKLNVQAAGRPGVYEVSGTTDLPNQSEISVAAIRYLRPKSDNFLDTETKATYSILDRQIVPIKQGKWQATLNLWQVASDGRFQEAWQLASSETGLSVNPASEVSFVATFDPTGQLLNPKQQGIDPKNIRGSLVRFTSEGLPYVQASQTLQVSLPAGKRTPPQLKAEEINGGWGDRYKLPSEPPVASRIPPQQFSTTQTNAPLSPSEFLR